MIHSSLGLYDRIKNAMANNIIMKKQFVIYFYSFMKNYFLFNYFDFPIYIFYIVTISYVIFY